MIEAVLRGAVALLPVLCFLAAMRFFDSYKLVHLRTTLGMIAAGVAGAVASYVLGGLLLDATGVDFTTYSRYIAPFIEEALKGAVLAWLIARQRVAFLVDAAICGFAVGAGFALAENVFYLRQLPDAAIGVWIVRGFGTALMHGGATAIFGILGLVLAERAGKPGLLVLVPGFLLAALLHSAYNHFFLSPMLATLGILIVLPPLVLLVFDRSESTLEEWLEVGFDADTELIELINSGELSQSKVGQYLDSLKSRFEGPVVADLLCYLRIRTELALRAKGILMMRENGFNPPLDEAAREGFAEMEYLETSIGPTGLLALRPFMRMSRRDLWQLYQIKH